LSAERALVARLAEFAKSPKENLEERFIATFEELKNAQRKLAQLQAQQLATLIPSFVANAESVGAVKLAIGAVGELSAVDELRTLTVQLRDQMQNDAAVAALFAMIAGKPMLVVAITKSAEATGVKAGDLVRVASTVLGGGGGGKPDIAQGGGSLADQIDTAMAAIRSELAK
jgi:alanyl-tRNA synthetase